MASKKLPTIKWLPTLYKKSSSGKILQWEIGVADTTITVAHGQVGGKIQTSNEILKSGKNAGRKNETAPAEQALKEAKSRWTKQKKSGYVDSIAKARSGDTDAIIEGGALPMLAKVFEDEEHKITFPCAIQPKLDGHRCIAIIQAGNVSLWTRTRKRITSVPHIVAKLEELAERTGLKNVILDGELYNHDLHRDFEKLTSLLRKQKPDAKDLEASADIVQYHVYDVMSDSQGFMERFSRLAELVIIGGRSIEIVDTKFANSMEEAQIYFELFMRMGYEGSMVRLLKMPYDNKRSHQLLKVKKFQDAEFEVIGVKEGRGKLAGHGIFQCKCHKSGVEFDVKMMGETENLKDYWENKDKYIGKMITVKFQDRTADSVPRFPVGLRFRADL